MYRSQLRRAISHEHFGKFRVETESEQNLWNECSRLVANAIIFYNTYILNRLIDQMAGANKFDLVEGIKKVSPIAWRHVNLGGRFNLISQENPLDIDQMIARLENFLLKSDN
jgi:Tn3 transposase DDE domain